MPQKDAHTFPQMLLARIAETPDKDAILYPEGATWRALSWHQVGERVRNIAGGLLSLGLMREQRVSLLASTRYEWVLADLGILCAGGATTTIYPSSTADEAEYIINDSESQVVFVEDDLQLEKILSVKARMPSLKHAVNVAGSGGHDGFVLTLAELEERGKQWHAANPEEYENVVHSVDKSSLATLIYTSGTTGKPKGVCLTHDCWVFEGEAVDQLGILSGNDLQYLWLPLAHSFGKVLEALIIRFGMTTAIDGRIDKIVDNLATIRPTFVAAVPRIFEKVYNKVITGAKEGGPLKWAIFKWALGVGKEASQKRQRGERAGGLKLAIADKLVFSKLRSRFGGRLRFFISGSAPLSRDIAEFFHAADLLILEGYGLTESSAASFVNRPYKYKFGTVGEPLPGIEVKIAPEDGEVLIRGRGIMTGYHNRPEDTQEALDAEGWLHTGDIGVLEPEGFLRITDRKKDLIKTSGGKYVAPQELEGQLKVRSPLISQALVHGNNRNFCTALLTLSEEELKKWADAHGKQGLSYAELTELPEVRALVGPIVEELNRALPSYSTIKKFAILPRDFAVETGELTPSMKLKRKHVEAAYKDILDGFYAGAIERSA